MTPCRRLTLQVLFKKPEAIDALEPDEQQVFRDLLELLQESDSNTSRVPFLDLLVSIKGDHLTTTLYRKQTATNSLLEFHSFHPHHVKNGVPTGSVPEDIPGECCPRHTNGLHLRHKLP
ncbi:uncharacterized protein ACNLHF_008254 isoform 1-T1 [Anomaloglossus baeobatrachus]